MPQPASNVAAITEDLYGSQAVPGDIATLGQPDFYREVGTRTSRLPSVALESTGESLALDSTSLDDNAAVSAVPLSTATVEEVADSFVAPSETSERIEDQSVFTSQPVLKDSLVSTYLKGPLPAATEASYGYPYLSSRASSLLAEIRAEGAGLRLNAETLGTFAWSPQFSWQSHAFYLEKVKGHINAVGERLAELQQIRHAVLPWQQQAIAEVTSHAAQVAASTQAAIVHLRENQNRLFVPEYRDHLRTIADRSGNMKQTVDKFLDYEKAQQRHRQLQDELEIASD
jgi:hypothetical protein